MKLSAGRPLLPLAVAAVVVASSQAAPTPERPQPRLHGRFLHITDFHPDEFYRPHTSPDAACHRGSGSAGPYGAATTSCDSPFALVNATLDWVAANLKHRIDFVVWTGDSARHDSDEKHPRSEASVLDSNRAVAAKVVDSLAASPGGKLAVPVIPTFGNNDFLPHNIMTPGPNAWFQAYADVWRRFIPEDQRHSFRHGGWFYVEVIPGKLAVFSLNTMFFFERNAAVDGCAHPSEPGFEHMEWLRVQLQLMRRRGLKAILMGHVPPARTDSKRNWDETCWQRYTLWLRQYRDVVTASVFGHMNIDHFLLQDTEELDLVGDLKTRRRHTPGLDQDLSVQSKSDYLQELRDEWSSLPDLGFGMLQETDDAGAEKRNKFHKIGGKHAERYHVSFVSPSIVPNYLPALRVYEYNITGLEDSALWEDPFDGTESSTTAAPQPEAEQLHLELKRQPAAEDEAGSYKKGKKKHKDRQRHRDNLIIPEAPPEESLPGPAHLAQPLTLTGYVQYYANLTRLDDAPEAVGCGEDPDGEEPRLRGFEYQVEYSTADDRFYKMQDLTVKRYLDLAYRMRQEKQGDAARADARGDDEASPRGDDGGVDAAKKNKKKKKKGKKNKKKREKNETWLHFLGHAFVQTVSKKDLKKM